MSAAHLLIAPNAFKDSCSALDAAQAMAAGARRACPDCTLELAPIADGGDGLLDVLEWLWQGRKQVERVRVQVQGPRHTQVSAALLWLPEERTAVIEMAQASGLALLAPQERDPTRTTSLGTGECLRAALNRGAERILIGLGGSATHDGGMGLATALGFRFLDADSHELAPIGANLGRVAEIDASHADPRLRQTEIVALRDVDNPLCGPQGAAAIYAPQKGARPEQIADLDSGLQRLAECFAQHLGAQIADQPGVGAAGGMGAGLVACCGARLEPGAAHVLELAEFPSRLRRANLVLIGEGALDGSSLRGKATGEIAARAAQSGVPCIALAGSVPVSPPTCAALRTAGISALFSLCAGPMAIEQAQTQTKPLLTAATEQVLRLWLTGAEFSVK